MSKPEALRLADECESRRVMNWVHATGETPRAVGTRPSEHDQRAAAELRRLHAECEALRHKARMWDVITLLWSGSEKPTLESIVVRFAEEQIAKAMAKEQTK